PKWNLFLLPTARSASGVAGLRIITGSEWADSNSYEIAASATHPAKAIATREGRVFTHTGWYVATGVPQPHCDETAHFEVGACWIQYIDTPRPH
ncbi:MAG TPA: hypothetical protein VFO27_03240, partial [Bryobacteraceae bacterium]|nr:hypothetical protein [Bryobacteraceae bacterium]